MACAIFHTKPWSEPMLFYLLQLDPQEQTSKTYKKDQKTYNYTFENIFCKMSATLCPMC